MGEEFYLNVKKIDPSDKFGNHENKKQKKDREKKVYEFEEVGNHFEDLAQSAARINEQLEEKNSPCRFFIYREKKEVFIDLVILDEQGKIKETMKKNITHHELLKIIGNIEKLDGFIVDYKI